MKRKIGYGARRDFLLLSGGKFYRAVPYDPDHGGCQPVWHEMYPGLLSQFAADLARMQREGLMVLGRTTRASDTRRVGVKWYQANKTGQNTCTLTPSGEAARDALLVPTQTVRCGNVRRYRGLRRPTCGCAHCAERYAAARGGA